MNNKKRFFCNNKRYMIELKKGDDFLKYKRILLKLSGEVLAGKKENGIDFDRTLSIAKEIKTCGELGYEIEEMAVLALYNSISNIERLDQATTLVEVKEIIDNAIYCEAHSGIRKALGILTASRYTDDEKIVLTEKDFK